MCHRFGSQAVFLLLGLSLYVSNAHAVLTGKTGTTTSGGTDSWGTTYTGGSCIGDAVGGKSGTSGTYVNDNGCVPYVAGTDSDGDTMPDSWEVSYYLNKYDSRDRYMDIDADGVTNAREYKLGTAPVTGVYGTPANPADTDGDGCPDSVDPNPTVAGTCQFNLNGTYKGIRVQQQSTTP